MPTPTGNDDTDVKLKKKKNRHSMGDDIHGVQTAKRTVAVESEELAERRSKSARRSGGAGCTPVSSRERTQQELDRAVIEGRQVEAVVKVADALDRMSGPKPTTKRHRAESEIAYATAKATADAAAVVAKAASVAKEAAAAAALHQYMHHEKKHWLPVRESAVTPTPEVNVEGGGYWTHEGGDKDEPDEGDVESPPDLSRGAGCLSCNGERFRHRGLRRLATDGLQEQSEDAPHRGQLKRARGDLRQRDDERAAASPPTVQVQVRQFNFNRLEDDSPLHRVKTRHCGRGLSNVQYPLLYKKMKALEKEQRSKEKDDRTRRDVDEVRTKVMNEEQWEHFCLEIKAQAAANEVEPTEKKTQHVMVGVPRSGSVDSALATLLLITEPDEDLSLIHI